MESRSDELKSAVESYQDICTNDQNLYVSEESVDEKCESLKKKWDSLNCSIPQRVDMLREEIQAWTRFYQELDSFTTWVDEMQGFTKIEKPRDEQEARDQLNQLEVCILWQFLRVTRIRKAFNIWHSDNELCHFVLDVFSRGTLIYLLE